MADYEEIIDFFNALNEYEIDLDDLGLTEDDLDDLDTDDFNDILDDVDDLIIDDDDDDETDEEDEIELNLPNPFDEED